MTQVSRRSDASNARPERRVSHSNEETFIQITKSLTGGRFIGLWRYFLRQWRGEINFWGIWIRKFASSTDFVSRLSFSSFVSFEQQTTNKCIEIFFQNTTNDAGPQSSIDSRTKSSDTTWLEVDSSATGRCWPSTSGLAATTSSTGPAPSANGSSWSSWWKLKRTVRNQPFSMLSSGLLLSNDELQNQ